MIHTYLIVKQNNIYSFTNFSKNFHPNCKYCFLNPWFP